MVVEWRLVLVSPGAGLEERRPPGRLLVLVWGVTCLAFVVDSFFLGAVEVQLLLLAVGLLFGFHLAVRTLAAVTRPRLSPWYWLRLPLCPLLVAGTLLAIEEELPTQAHLRM